MIVDPRHANDPHGARSDESVDRVQSGPADLTLCVIPIPSISTAHNAQVLGSPVVEGLRTHLDLPILGISPVQGPLTREEPALVQGPLTHLGIPLGEGLSKERLRRLLGAVFPDVSVSRRPEGPRDQEMSP